MHGASIASVSKTHFLVLIHKLSSIYVFSYFPFGFEGRIWDLIVSVPDHCLSFYFLLDLPFPPTVERSMSSDCV